MTTNDLIVTKTKCTGCEACSQICAKHAISMVEDSEGFRYPSIDSNSCVDCGMCKKVCPIENMPEQFASDKLVFGGYVKDDVVREKSTSGGAFTAIVEAWCDNNYVIFGAETKGLEVQHGYILNKGELDRFRKSKYTQSIIGNSYKQAKSFLKEGKKVLFSGTPCQIAGLRSFLGNTDTSNLLTIEVICEGVPTPLFVRKLNSHFESKHGSSIDSIDYRYKDGARWDFQVMLINITSKSHQHQTFKCDRWFNPFWSIWLQHLMSRPSCYECRFTNTARVADISLGDLWGVHIYCPELYGNNGGASLIICNTDKGKEALRKSEGLLFGHELSFDDALRFQGPMRKSIEMNPNREQFMKDVITYDYNTIVKKWARKSPLKLLFQKYIFGNNAQKVWWYKFKKKIGLL